MIPKLRKKFNAEFTTQKYQSFLNDLDFEFGYHIDFRIAETPVFLTKELVNELIGAGDQILSYIQSDEFKINSSNAIPEGIEVPNEDEHAKVIAIDFAICQDKNSNLIPQLIELQGFPSLYFYQELLNMKYRKHFNIPDGFTNFFNSYDHDSYIDALRKLIDADKDPKNVILMEIEPEKQKTRIDFSCTEKFIGVKPVCITKISKEGRRLFYTENGKKIYIERIYNRVIFDELIKHKDLKLNFSFHDELDIEWIPHPNWFFRISKQTLPYLKNKYVPETHFLNDFDFKAHSMNDYVLKPLYSFAGSGVKYDISESEIESIHDRQNYIIQKKIYYSPLIITPGIPAKAEVRLLYIWDDKPILVNNIVRLSKGLMMGVDYNKDKTWVGSSIAYHKL